MSNHSSHRLDRDANRDHMILSQIWDQWVDNLKEWKNYLAQSRRDDEESGIRHSVTLFRRRLVSANSLLRNARMHHKPKSAGSAHIPARQTVPRNAPGHHQFPESEYPILQFALFIVGSLPQLLENKEGRKARRRRRSIAINDRFHMWSEKIRLHPLAFLGAALPIAAITAFFSFYTLATSASYNGYDLGTVAGLATVRSAVSQLEEETRRTLDDKDYAVDQDLLLTKTHFVPRRTLIDKDSFSTNLTRQLGEITYAYTLYVDGQPIAATTYAGALEELLQQLRQGYSSANTVDSYFTEDVEIRQEYVSNEYVMNLGYIAETLNETKEGAITYTVQSGDAPLSIAEDYNISYEDLKAMNPGYNWSVLTVGDVLTISNAVPYLTVVNVEQQRYVQSIPYAVEYTEDNTMYQGDYKVLSAGSYGKADVVANVTLINGEEIERDIVSSVTLLAPITEQQATGTLPRPSWFPTGSFRWPCNGYITSYFGYRNTGIRGASTYHQAIDIANSYGTSIYASDGGTVITSGWYGGTGYTVRIDHGNGYITTYGHNSSLTCSVGDHVYKGEQIARMGSTGVSSGNHCHFAIQLNGTYVNPLNYLQ